MARPTDTVVRSERTQRNNQRPDNRWRFLRAANLCHRYVEGTDWAYSEFAVYDLGQAVAHMTVQARALALFVRQFRAFDRAGLTTEFAVPEHWKVTTMAAIGRVPPHVGDPTASGSSAR